MVVAGGRDTALESAKEAARLKAALPCAFTKVGWVAVWWRRPPVRCESAWLAPTAKRHSLWCFAVGASVEDGVKFGGLGRLEGLGCLKGRASAHGAPTTPLPAHTQRQHLLLDLGGTTERHCGGVMRT